MDHAFRQVRRGSGPPDALTACRAGSPRSACGSTRPPPPRSSQPRARPARRTEGSFPSPAVHRSCSVTGPRASTSGSRRNRTCPCSLCSVTLVIVLSPALNGESRNHPGVGAVVLGVNTRTRLVVASLGDGLRARAQHRKGNDASLTGAGGNCLGQLWGHLGGPRANEPMDTTTCVLSYLNRLPFAIGKGGAVHLNGSLGHHFADTSGTVQPSFGAAPS